MLGAVRSILSSSDTPDPSPGEGAGVDLSIDDALQLLSNSRRRHVIHYLAHDTPETTTGELADHIAGLEAEDVEDVDTEDRKSVYITLYQNHLPMLDNAGVIEHGDRQHAVHATPATDALADILTHAETRLNGGDA